MARQLRRLNLTKLALVDRPANPMAHVIIAKRETPEPLTYDEVRAILRREQPPEPSR